MSSFVLVTKVPYYRSTHLFSIVRTAMIACHAAQGCPAICHQVPALCHCIDASKVSARTVDLNVEVCLCRAASPWMLSFQSLLLSALGTTPNLEDDAGPLLWPLAPGHGRHCSLWFRSFSRRGPNVRAMQVREQLSRGKVVPEPIGTVEYDTD